MPIIACGIESNRILLSDKHYHKVELSEQAMGTIQHALYTLYHAFVAEPDYRKLISETQQIINNELERPAYTDPLNPPR